MGLLAVSRLVLASVQGAPPGPETSPARMAGARFYEEAFVQKVEAGKFDPFEYYAGSPFSLSFEAPGKLKIDWGQEYQECAVAARGTAPRFAITLRCGDSTIEGEWTWLGPGRARVTGLANVEAEGRPLILAYLSQTVDRLVGEYERRFAARHLPAVVGSYADGAGGSVVVTRDGRARMGSRSLTLRVRECLHYEPGAKKGTRIACLELEEPAPAEPGTERVLAAVPSAGGLVLIEGHYSEDLDPDGLAFVPESKGRRYRRSP